MLNQTKGFVIAFLGSMKLLIRSRKSRLLKNEDLYQKKKRLDRGNPFIVCCPSPITQIVHWFSSNIEIYCCTNISMSAV